MKKPTIRMDEVEWRPPKRHNWPIWVTVWGRMVKEKRLATVGLAIIVLFLFAGIFSDLIAPEGYREEHTDRLGVVEEGGIEILELVGPTLNPFHPLGLDHRGRDVLSLIIHGARISMFVGLGTVALGISLATIVGMGSAWLGGKYDTIIQRVVDGVMIFPWLVLVLVIVTTLPAKSPIGWVDTEQWGLAKVIFTLGVLNVAWVSRIIRSSTLAARENQYIDAARALGAPGHRIMLRHLLPNIMAPIITVATLSLGYAILAEAVLSFLGYGIPPPNPSWGNIMNIAGGLYLFRAPWLIIAPGLAISLVVFAINVLGDSLRDLLDPRLKGSSAHPGV